MNTPFDGHQYLASFERNGQKGHLTINIDNDRNGQGVAYLAMHDPLSFSIFDCSITDFNANSISGTAKRSITLEAAHGQQIETSTDSTAPFIFELNKTEIPHKLSYECQGEKNELFLLPVISAAIAETTKISTWEGFRAWVDDVRTNDRSAIFRGIARSSYGLKTSFHRTGRVDLERFRDSDFPMFRDLAETIGGIKFTGAPEDNGALWGYAQHHGFPTPLLDWTESPYIAAYFAFSERLENQKLNDDEPVKIYYLNGKFVEINRPMNVKISDVYPRVWVFKPSSKGNQRLVFQQGLFLMSNILEIEAYLVSLNKENLRAIEMPVALARKVIDELAYMGVNHLSLFPGLDGAAKHAMYKQFYKPV